MRKGSLWWIGKPGVTPSRLSDMITKSSFPCQDGNLTKWLLTETKRSLIRRVRFFCILFFVDFLQFSLIGTVLNLNKGRSGRKPTALTEARLQMMENMLEGICLLYKSIFYFIKIILVESELPARVARSSCRKHRLPEPMSKSSFNRGIKKLGFHPYKLVYK